MTPSVDIELVRPAVSDGGIYGVEGAGVPERWAWRIGAGTQYEHAPVLVLTEGQITSRPVTDRLGLWGGFSLGLGWNLAAQVVLPLAWQTGDDPLMPTSGAGLGDPRLGVRWRALHTQALDATLRGDLYLPIGQRQAWLGESSARAAVGASGALHGGFGDVLLDVGLVGRPLEEPAPGLDWGPSVDLGVGARVNLTDRLDVGGAWAARAILAGLATQDGELASELLASTRFAVSDTTHLQGGAGLGLQPGVGVPTWRVFATAQFEGLAPKRRAQVEAAKEPPPPPPKPVDAATILAEADPVVAPPPPPPPEPPAVVKGDEIVIRDEIKFKQGSAELLPESHATIVALADLLASDGRIAHLAIEGHASEEGGLAYNWDLSDRRARAVWEALVVEGVNPQRMSWRGLGEIVPDAAQAATRRVAFHITRRLAQDEALPTTPPTALLPWNGETVALDAVSIPAPPPPPPKETLDKSFFEEDDE